MVVDVCAPFFQPVLTAEENPFVVGLRSGLTQAGSAFPARGAMAAAGNEGADHVIADGEIPDTFAHLDHFACRLVSEGHRGGAGAIPIDDRQVGMT